MAHLHDVRDADTHYIIDPVTMAITNANEAKNTLQLGDHGSEIYTFEIPEYVEGHDMSLCNMVEVHFINIGANKADQSIGVYKVTDLTLDKDVPGTLVFTWKVLGDCTKYAGSLNYRIKFACTDDSGNYTYKKWTKVFKGITIEDGFDNGAAVAEEHSDILSEWEARLDALEQSGGGADWNAAEGEPGHVLNRTHRAEHFNPIVWPDSLNPDESYDFGYIFEMDSLLFYRVNGYWSMPEYQNPVAYTLIAGGQDKNASLTKIDAESAGLPSFVSIYELTSWIAIDETTIDTLYTFIFASISANSQDIPEGLFMACVAYPTEVEGIRNFASGCVKLMDETVHKLPNKFLDLDWLPKKETSTETEAYLAEITLDDFLDKIDHSSTTYDGVEMTDGQTYKIYFDGSEYTCTAKSIMNYGYEGVYVGNGGLMGDGNDGSIPVSSEPFLIYSIPSMYENRIAVCKEGLDPVTLRIDKVNITEEYNKLPVGYLPEPELLGEITISTANATASGGTLILYEKSLQAEMEAILAKARTLVKPMFVQSEIMDLVTRYNATYCGASTALNAVEHIQLLFGAFENDTPSYYLYALLAYGLSTTHAAIHQAFSAGLPITIKFYAL